MADDFQIAKADYYFANPERTELALEGVDLFVAKGGIIYPPMIEHFGFVNGVPAILALPDEGEVTVEVTDPERLRRYLEEMSVPDVEMPTPTRFVFPTFGRDEDG